MKSHHRAAATPPLGDPPRSRGGFGMPLLARELTEQAARKRTWILRVVFAVLLYVPFLLRLSMVGNYHWTYAMEMGMGRSLLSVSVKFQMLGIVLLLPAMMAGVIASEKERNTLELLLISGLSARAIVTEKLCSRLVAVLSFLLVGAPLLALSYAFGGVTVAHLLRAVYLLLLTCLQVGAVSLLCSVHCHSSFSALLSAYGLIGALYGLGLYKSSSSIHLPQVYLCPLQVYFSNYPSPASIVQCSILVWAMVAGCYLGAVWLLREWALKPPRNPLLVIFGKLDRIMNRLNSLAGGVVIARDSDRLLMNEPVAWREMTRQPLGRIRYLLRVLSVAMLLVFVAVILAIESHETTVLSLAVILVWCLAVIVIGLAGVNTIASERLRQTMDVLLTTTLSGADIIDQKMRAVRRLSVVIGLVLGVLCLCSVWLRVMLNDVWVRLYGSGEPVYLGVSLLMIVVYLPLIARIGCWLGLRIRNRTRAAAATISLIAAICCLPPLVLMAFLPGVPREWEILYAVLLRLSPGAVLLANELPQRELNVGIETTTALHFVVLALISFSLSRYLRANADRLLGRIPGQPAGGSRPDSDTPPERRSAP